MYRNGRPNLEIFCRYAYSSLEHFTYTHHTYSILIYSRISLRIVCLNIQRNYIIHSFFNYDTIFKGAIRMI